MFDVQRLLTTDKLLDMHAQASTDCRYLIVRMIEVELRWRSHSYELVGDKLYLVATEHADPIVRSIWRRGVYNVDNRSVERLIAKYATLSASQVNTQD